MDRVGSSLVKGASTAENRRSALATLLGYATGDSIGLTYGMTRRFLPSLPTAPAALLVGLAAMAATDASGTALGTTDPRSWSARAWLSDLIPHIAYGAGVVATYDVLDGVSS